MSTSAPTPSSGGRRREGTGVYLVAFLLSILLHAGAFWLLPSFFAVVPEPSGQPSPDQPARSARGMQVVQLSEVSEAGQEPLRTPTLPVEPTFDEPESPEADAPVRDDQPEVVDEPPPTAPGAPTVAERIRPPLEGDPRIWRPVDPSLTELTPADRALIRIYATLDELADSLVDAQERERRAREWLFTDAEGNQWGISPGRLHLGGTTIPIPTVAPPPSVEDQRIRWQYDDAQRAADIARIRDAWENRAEAIRERMDAEREAERERDANQTAPDSAGPGG